MNTFYTPSLRLFKHVLSACCVLIAAHIAPLSHAQKLPDINPAAGVKTLPPSSSTAKTFGGSAITQCGAANGGMFPSPPASGLCAAGSVVTVPIAALGATQYQWTCGSPPPVSGVLTLPSLVAPSVCTANKKYNGQCGAASGASSAGVPTANLCALGTASTPVQAGANYTWSCTGVLPATGATVVNCSAPSLVYAVSETENTTAGTAGSVNVRANDTAPAGSAYSIAPGSTCSPVSISALGVANYTAPAAGQSCTLNYTVCNSGQCSAATLTVTSAPPPPPLVQAVSEAISSTAGTAGSTNVRANDTAPAGSTYALAPGSTCSPVSISALGVASYTAPAAGQSCTLNYTVCNSGQCSTATLTVSSAPIAMIVQAVSETVSSPAGTAGSTNVRANDTAPAGSVYSIAPGSTCSPVGITNLGVASYTAPAAGQSCTLNYTVCNSGQCSTATLTVTSPGTSSGTGGGIGVGTVIPHVLTANTLPTTPTLPAIPQVLTANPVTGAVLADISALTSRFSKVSRPAGGFYDVTECVKDNVTGLIWEGKTTGGARSGSNTYTNYDDVTQAQIWTSSGTVNPTLAQVNASNNSMGYKNTVNGLSLCGSGAWRMPTSAELGVLSTASGGYGSSTQTTWLPNTGGSWFWSSSPYVGYAGYAWVVGFGNGYVYGGGYRGSSDYVRLVRAGQ
jgi:hypothetical protein